MSPPSIHIVENVIRAIVGRTLEALPHETGGALVGWREGAAVIVMDFIEISSGKPLRARYDLGIADLNSALADYLSSATDARMGYVGSWHSHPAAVGPSFIDRCTFRKTSRAHANPLAFVVAATDGRSTGLHLTWAGRRGGRYRLVEQETITRGGDDRGQR
ncbi:MAG: Mov34/MPN/PAD-1 family protein [Micropruina sp.]|nr:Mov34/MPN/PAD-1 family protein [Micropruina sp.]